MLNSRIRVLYLQPAPLFGGAERQAAEQAAFLPALDVDPVVVGGPGRAIDDWMRGLPRGRFIHSPNFPGGWPALHGLSRVATPWRYVACGLAARAEFARLVERERIDVIVASLPFTWIVGTLVARKAGIPVVWRAGGSRIPLFQKVILWCLTRWLRPDLLICNGKAVRRLFHALIPGPVVVVPNGIDTDLFNPGAGDRTRYRPADARAVVGFAGRLARSKHPEAVLALAARLLESHPGVHVLVAGEGSERAKTELEARRLGLDNVTFLGFVLDMPSFYAACDVIVLPSDSEGCPNVVLEAMMSEKAVVAADIEPILELVESGKTGLVYPLGDTPALVDAVVRLLAEPERRASMGRAAHARVREFTVAAAAEHLAHALRDVVARSARTQPDRERQSSFGW